MDLTPEKFQEVFNKANGLEVAVKQEREEKKALNEKLKEYEARLNEISEKEAKEKGDIMSLLEKKELMIKEKEEEINKLKWKADSREEFQNKKQEDLTKRETELMKKMTDNLKSEYSDIIESLDLEKKVKFLEKITDENKVGKFWTPPTSKTVNNNWFETLTLNAFDKLSPEKRKDYMSKSVEIHWEVQFSQTD